MRVKKKKLWGPIVLGFILLYLVMMLAATWLTALKFQDEFRNNMTLLLTNFQQWVENNENNMQEQGVDSRQEREGYYSYLTSQSIPDSSNEAFQQFSGAVYDLNGTLLAQTDEVIGGSSASSENGFKTVYQYDTLDFLTVEEKEELAGYARKYYDTRSPGPNQYAVIARKKADTGELCGILVEKLLWEKEETADGTVPVTYVDPYTGSSLAFDTGDEVYRQVGCELVWEWEKPGVEEAAWVKSTIQPEIAHVQFPYLTYGGEKLWKKWRESEFLRSFPKQADMEDFLQKNIWTRYEKLYSKAGGRETQESLMAPVYKDTDGNIFCYVELRAESHPWQAAMDYLKYVYLSGFVLMLLCMAGIIRASDKIYERQAALEEMRRDFTNAMAHELKTPLGIIRGFAENLQEHLMEEKRDYYLEQIIGQTEEMDKLVAQMITVSKMDSEHLALQKETLSMAELIREQIQKFSPMLEEKELQVEYDCDRDFQVEGDREYLAKAVWNLLSNAVEYSVPGGSIRIYTEPGRCVIENTGFPMSEETLVHACDMFYRQDESRSERERHMGLGLFLTKKILGLHHLKLDLKNTEDGVRVSIEK